jgi:integrase
MIEGRRRPEPLGGFCEILRGQKTKRPPRTIDLLGALRHDLLELRLASGRPGDDALVFPASDGAPRREHDYRNWRRRQFQKLAPDCGLSRRPYDLRHSFVSLLIQEGRLSIVEIAEQLGHNRHPPSTSDAARSPLLIAPSM